MSDTLELIYREARLLDEHRYEEWLELFTTDARYWAPHRWAAVEPINEMNLLYDDHARLAERIARLTGGDLHAQDPRSSTVRLLGYPVQESANTWTPPGKFDEVLTTPFALHEYRNDVNMHYSGRYTYWLSQREGEWKIAAKKINLLGAEGVLENVTFLL